MNTQTLILWMTAILLASLAFIFYTTVKTRIARSYVGILVYFALWATCIGVFYVVTEPLHIVIVNSVADFTIVLVCAQFFYICTVLRDKETTPKSVLPLLTAAEIVIALLFLTTELFDLHSAPAGMSPTEMRNYLFNGSSALYYLTLISFIGMGAYRVVKASRVETDPGRKRQLLYFAAGAVIGTFPAFTVALFFPRLADQYGYYWLAPILILPWVTITTHALSQMYSLRIRIVLIKVAMYTMAGILLLYSLIGPSVAIPYMSVIVFAAFASVGIFFVSTLVRSEEQRERLDILSTEFKNLNANLSIRVDEQTKAARDAQAHTDIVVESLTSGIVEFDMSRKVLRINRAAERILGITRGEVLGRTITPLDRKIASLEGIARAAFPAERDRDATTPPPVISTPNAHTVTIEHPTHTELSISLAPIIATTKEQTGYISVIEDITRARLVARAKSEFISVAAHQLRTPLSVIKWSFSTLLSGDVGELTTKQHETVQNAYTTNANMVELVNDLLDVARIEDEQFGYSFAEGSLESLLETIVHDYVPAAEAKKIRFVTDIKQKNIEPFMFDAARLSLALRGVIDNSFRYTRENGIISISLDRIDNNAIILITDSGIGIPKNQREKLFTKFFRARNAIDLAPEGSGLGLFVAHTILSRHNGGITIDSEENKGTIVSLTLPIAHTPPDGQIVK